MKINLNHKYYYLFLLAVNLTWMFLGRDYYNNYSPFVWFVNGPVFAISHFNNLAAFSSLLNVKEPLLYKKYEVYFGYFKNDMITTMSLFGNRDFQQLKDDELIHKYILAKRSYNYLLLCFISFGISGIATIFVK
jgi:hypothetical protein